LEIHGTILHGKRVSPDLLVGAVGTLAEGLGIRAVARVCEVDPNTVLQWLVEAAEQLQAFSQYLLHDVHVTQVQLDELFARLSAVKAGEISASAAIQRLSRSPHWVWVPLFLTDGFTEYTTARLTHDGQWIQPARRQATGPHPKPRWLPLPQLLSAQVVKTVRRRRLVHVRPRVVFGTIEAVQQVLSTRLKVF
jgi:hypothetical protein